MKEGAGQKASLADRVRDRYAVGYLALLGAALALAYASWPIFAADTDLWYHLTAGRYIATLHELPHDAFYSFLRPTPVALDYYWLAQLVYYAVHSVAGYVGVVELRALVALGTYALVLATLRLGRSGEAWGGSAVVFTPVALFLIGRLTLARPCDFSYLAIAGFLFALESRRGLFALPALALVWMNLHGIEYPVMLLILGAYLGEWTLARLGLLAQPAPAWPAFAAAGASMLAVLATPHGVALVAAPFTPLTFASQYIEELKPADVSRLLALHVDGLYVSRATFLALLVAASAAAALGSLRRSAWRPAHWALLAGGGVLLLRAQRFSAEFVLLAVPLLAAWRPRLPALVGVPETLRAGLVVALSVFPFWHLRALLDTSCIFPLCVRGLPEGAVAFLARVDAHGAVLNHPNDGGYLEWELHPRQQIFADLQTPFLFSDRDVYVAQQAFRDPAVFSALISEYRPAFLVVPRKLYEFGGWVGRVSDYAPVFADDASVLYASSDSQAELVARYRLTTIDPFALRLTGDPADPETAARAAAELARAAEIYPAGASLALLEGALALERGDADAALRIADRVTRLDPKRPEPQRLRGDALLRQGHPAEAAAAYETALQRSEAELARGDDPEIAGRVSDLERRLWLSYSRSGRKEEAYRALRRALGDLYRPAVGYQELASLGIAALDAGRAAEGETLLEFALAKTPPTEPELRRRLEAKLRSLAATR